MPNALNDLLDVYRKASKKEREKGTYFELLIKDFLKNDPRFAPQFDDIFTYAEWAEKQDISKNNGQCKIPTRAIPARDYCKFRGYKNSEGIT